MGYLVKYLFDVPPKVVEEFRKCDNTTHTQWGMVWEAAKNESIIGEEGEKDGAGLKKKKDDEFTLALFAGGKAAHVISNPPDSDKLGIINDYHIILLLLFYYWLIINVYIRCGSGSQEVYF